jgi:phosphatidate cytidylyltransferase
VTEAPANPAAELMTRVTMGIVMAAVACAAAYYGSWPFRALVTAAAGVMTIEWFDLHRLPRRSAYVAAGLLAVALLGGIEYFYPDAMPSLDDDMSIQLSADDFYPVLTACAGLAALGALVATATRRIAPGWGALYIGAPAFALMVLSWAYSGLVFWVMAVTWGTDIFAYFAGRGIGGPKLAPAISPKKTWAGLVGGMIGAGLAGWGVAWLFSLGAPFQWIGAPMAVVAQAGDLYESWVKRRAGVKDSGTLLPGHGGVLDRLDGLLAVSAATMALLLMDLWTG